MTADKDNGKNRLGARMNGNESSSSECWRFNTIPFSALTFSFTGLITGSVSMSDNHRHHATSVHVPQCQTTPSTPLHQCTHLSVRQPQAPRYISAHTSMSDNHKHPATSVHTPQCQTTPSTPLHQYTRLNVRQPQAPCYISTCTKKGDSWRVCESTGA